MYPLDLISMREHALQAGHVRYLIHTYVYGNEKNNK